MMMKYDWLTELYSLGPVENKVLSHGTLAVTDVRPSPDFTEEPKL